MFYKHTDTGYIIRIRVTPNAAKCGITGIFTDDKGTDFLKISVTAIPEKGKANRELIKWLSRYLQIRKSSIVLIHGETDRNKIFRIDRKLLPETEALLLTWDQKK